MAAVMCDELLPVEAERARVAAATLHLGEAEMSMPPVPQVGS